MDAARRLSEKVYRFACNQRMRGTPLVESTSDIKIASAPGRTFWGYRTDSTPAAGCTQSDKLFRSIVAKRHFGILDAKILAEKQ
jgi:hypothetical protein